MNKFKYALLVVLSMCIFSCGGGGEQNSQEEKPNTNSESEANTENASENSTSSSLCFSSEEELTKMYLNLQMNGDQISGTSEYLTPKSNMTLFSVSNIEGTREGDTFKLTFTVVEGDDGGEIGYSYEEIWSLDESGEKLLSQSENALIPLLNLIECDPNADMERQAIREAQKEAEGEPMFDNQFYYSGTIDEKLKIQMFLESEPDPEDEAQTLVNGYYYYESQGADNTILLEGILVDAPGIASSLVEVKDGKEYGRFMIEPGYSLGQTIECIWVSADGSKELSTVLTPSK